MKLNYIYIILVLLILLVYPHFVVLVHHPKYTVQWSSAKIPFCVFTKTSTNKFELYTGMRNDGVFVWKKVTPSIEYK